MNATSSLRPAAACAVALLLGAGIAGALSDLRTWTSTSGQKISASLEKVDGNTVILVDTNGGKLSIDATRLSEADRAYLAPFRQRAIASAPDKAVAPVAEADEAAFMAVIKRSCLRCHPKACASVADLVSTKWLVPGKPEKSPVFTIIGKNRKPGGTYHNLSDGDTGIVRDFVTAYREK